MRHAGYSVEVNPDTGLVATCMLFEGHRTLHDLLDAAFRREETLEDPVQGVCRIPAPPSTSQEALWEIYLPETLAEYPDHLT